MCDNCKKHGKTYPIGIRQLCAPCSAAVLRPFLANYGYSKSKIEQRLRELQTDPDRLEQWGGVCGFAAGVHEILTDKVKSRDLFEATFHDIEPSYDAHYRFPDGSLAAIPLSSASRSSGS